MKTRIIDKRLRDLSRKLEDLPPPVPMLNFDASFTEPEKKLIIKVQEVLDEYELSPRLSLLKENQEYFSKVIEVASWRVFELFKSVVVRNMGGGELAEIYFGLAFLDFMRELKRCRPSVDKWNLEKELLRKKANEDLATKVPGAPGVDSVDDWRSGLEG